MTIMDKGIIISISSILNPIPIILMNRLPIRVIINRIHITKDIITTEVTTKTHIIIMATTGTMIPTIIPTTIITMIIMKITTTLPMYMAILDVMIATMTNMAIS